MKTKLFKACALLLMVPLMLTVAKGQSVYSNLVMSLHPVAYWPLQESVPPPRYDTETNIGSLGPIGNLYYFDTQNYLTNFGAFNDGALCHYMPSGDNGGAIVPPTDHRVGLPSTQQFTVEGWFRMTESSGYSGIVNETGGQGSGGINDTANSGGWELVQNFTPYRTATPNSPSCFAFHVFNGDSSTGGADVEVTNAAAGEWLVGGNAGYVNTWVYLAGVFDGTNAWLYMFGTNLNNATGGPYSVGYGSTNATVYQIPISAGINTAYFGAPTLSTTYTNYVSDYWDPILFGETRSYNGNHDFGGEMQDVAIYTNALTFLQISNHFNAGTNGLGQYQSTIANDNPFMHWRMNAPNWANNYQANTFPVANNYGSAASTFTNNNAGLSGANSAIYQPGTLPGYPGLVGAGFGPFTNCCAFNGLEGVVDVGVSPAINPTGYTNSYSLVAWCKGDPMDALGGRFQCPASHGALSWKAQFHNGTTYGATIGGGTSATIAPNATTYYPNDGQWHMYSLVATYIGGSTTNFIVYLDNGANSVTLNYPVGVPGSNTMDAFIGGDPDPQYMQPTNYGTYNSSEQEFQGDVAHVAFFNSALTLNQIQSLYYTANPAPTIIRQPVSALAGLSSIFTNSVIVAGTGPFYYQWFTNNVPLSGATSSNLVINPVVVSSASSDYYVVITNIYGTVTSSAVSLTVVSNIQFIAQYPISYTNLITLYGGGNIGGTNYLGSTPTFSVNAVGASPISYQWETNGVAVGWGTNPGFTFTNCQMTSPTNFQCILNNSFGSVTSKLWAVNYAQAPMAPFPQIVLAAQPVGYWRLNEPDDGNYDGNPGTLAEDYESGNNGIYTNVYLGDFNGGTGYDPITDPTETSAQFGFFATTASFAGSVGTNVDLTTPAGVNAEYTVAVWANGYNNVQPANAGLVTKGIFYGEELNIDEGGPVDALGHDTLRFEVRDAGGGDHDAYTSDDLRVMPGWHFIVGVCDEVNGAISIYVDGSLAGTAAMPVQGGIVNSATVPLMIGARSTAATPLGNNQFVGFLNDVAIYNYAMTPSQVAAQYDGAGIPAFFVQQPPVSTNVDGGSTLVVPVTVGGTQPISLQWFDGNGPIIGQTSSTLTIPNISVTDTYYLMASNNINGVPYTANSSEVTAYVYSGAPQITTQVQNPFYALLGQTASDSATVYGELPLVYQWQFYNANSGWVNVTNNARISGALGSALSIGSVQSSDAGNYQLVITNIYGATTSSVATLTIPGVLPLTFGNGLGWTIGTGSTFSGGVLTLTYGTTGNGTYFFQVPQYIGAFEASFTYQAQYDTTFPYADGITFCVQNDPRGPSATGSGGGDLGYTGITPSAALEMNIYSGYGIGYAFGADGAINTYTYPGTVNLTNGAVNVSILYANGQMAVTFSNQVGGATYSTLVNVGSIPQIVGSSTAYVGFTGAFGGSTSVQTIQNFQFASLPPQSIQLTGNNAVITWPGSINGPYTVQENPSLTTNNWVNVTNVTPALVNGVNQAIVPTGGSNLMYYRLILSQP